MDNYKVEVAFRQSRTNLADLPSSIVSLLYNASVAPQEVILEIISNSQTNVYIGWSGMSSSTSKTIGIDPISAQSLHLVERQSVRLNVKIHNDRTSQIMLEPVHFSDWELVQIYASYIESKLVEQSRCVALSQTLVVYPTRTSSILLRVTSIGTNQNFALIDPFAEVSIMPKKQDRKSNICSHHREPGEYPGKSMQSPWVLKRGISIPNSYFPFINTEQESFQFEIYGNSCEFKHILGKCEYVMVSIVTGLTHKPKIINPPEGADLEDASKISKRVNNAEAIKANRSIIARFVDYSGAPKNTIGLSRSLAIALNVEGDLGYKVTLKMAPKSLGKKPSTLIVYPFTPRIKKKDQIPRHSRDFQAEKSQILLKFFSSQQKLLSPITNFCRIPAIPGSLTHGGILKFKGIQDLHSWIEPSSSRSSRYKPRIDIRDEIPCTFSESWGDTEELSCETGLIYGLDVLIGELKTHLSIFKCTGIMVYGSKGSGKTVCLKMLARECKQSTILNTEYVACEALVNENFDEIRSKISKIFQKAVWNQPSVVMFDNLDKLIPAELDNTDIARSHQLTEYLVSFMQTVCSQKNISVSLIISGASKESLNKVFIQSHIIEKFSFIDAPDKATRATILKENLTRRLMCSLSFDLMDVVSETDGYLPNDLKILSDRMYFESLQDSQLRSQVYSETREECCVTRRNFEAAVSDFKPSSLKGVKLQKSGINWEDIGGMSEAKRVLLETLEWPTKYAPIFDNCPLRLRSGLLFYGYPGCGKTLLASSIAGKCGLNYISIKGPELLNKYIGASEQSVRELFERAQSAKPCILFFDEFDSIAPKRGHDSTGVTDRVVNQMLTQMDGAEGLDGVYVLAATSRPDLIDPALLRPGRLDKSIFCDMPDFNDRLNILSCICQKMSLSDDVRLEDIASQTDEFSGADLQGLAYNAYLKAVHEVLSNEARCSIPILKESIAVTDFFSIDLEGRKAIRTGKTVDLQKQIKSIIERDNQLNKSHIATGDTKKTQVKIGNSHFSSSLRETKSSISVSEKSKLNQVYSKFSTCRDGNMSDGSVSQEVGGRSTLM